MSENRKQARIATSLSLRLVAAALIWMLFLLGIGGAVLTLAFRQSAVQEFGHRLDAVLRTVIAAAEVGPDGSLIVKPSLGDPRFEQIFSGWYWQVAGPSGRLTRSRSLWDSTLPVHTDGDERREIEGPKGEPLLVVERDIEFPGLGGPVHMLIAGDMRELSDRTRSFNTLLFATIGLFALGMAIAIVIQVRFGLRPLRLLTDRLALVRSGKEKHLTGVYPREVAPLVETMNAILDHDAELIQRARTHVGNLAHGLKTPLAVLQTELRGNPDKAAIETQLRRMSRLIDHHLARAAAMAGSGRALGLQVDVRSTASDIASVLSRIHADKRIETMIDMDAHITFRGSREDLEEMLGNLMENAWKWARRRVLISARVAEGNLHIAVEDDGPGLSEEQTAAVMQRGAKLDETVPGWGLGLGIVADIAALNDGTIAIGRSDLGGVKAELSLPGSA
ncbi:MAG TPA: ATP-binding protein [Ferrovibrio sp.]|uniref:ATP-binding protein n=1 Tax=Ferrovibrio sp. TaxID=1917215 RepID=UPI002ECFB3F9